VIIYNQKIAIVDDFFLFCIDFLLNRFLVRVQTAN